MESSVKNMKTSDVLEPHQHRACVGGRVMVFANVEFDAENPPRELLIDGIRYMRKYDDFKRTSSQKH